MTSIRHIVIVGAGLAGAKAAEALRSQGYDGQIQLVGEEAERPYTRPPLSKGYLRGEMERDAFRVHADGFYAEQAIELIVGVRVHGIDRPGRAVVLADDRRLPFDRLLLATGAAPRGLEVEGADLPGVLDLRTLDDADRLKAAIGDADRIVVAGAGWIGSEVAASLRSMGRSVTLLASRRTPLEAVLGPEVGRVLSELHGERGVDLRGRARVARVLGTDRATGVELEDGERIPADLVVAATGVAPRDGLARAAGLGVSDGVDVSATLETSDPGIFAAGDLAAAWHPFFERRIRVEHLSNARLQGTAAGSLLLGGTEPFDAIPSFLSEQHGVRVQYVGYAPATSRVIVRGRLEDRSFVAFRLVAGRVLAGIAVDAPDAAKALPALIRAAAPIDASALADPGLPIEALVSQAETASAASATAARATADRF